jgi:hypothetical protein
VQPPASRRAGRVFARRQAQFHVGLAPEAEILVHILDPFQRLQRERAVVLLDNLVEVDRGGGLPVLVEADSAGRAGEFEIAQRLVQGRVIVRQIPLDLLQGKKCSLGFGVIVGGEERRRRERPSSP